MKFGQIYHDFIRPFQTLYYLLIKPKTFGVKILIINHNKFLYIRNTYGNKYWTFPGGAVEKNESPKNAAIREAFEETGISISNPIFIGKFKSTKHYKRDTVYCFYSHTNNKRILYDSKEILDAQWIGTDSLPTPKSFSVEKILALYKKHYGSQHKFSN